MKRFFKTVNAYLNKIILFLLCSCIIQFATGIAMTLTLDQLSGFRGSTVVGRPIFSGLGFTVGRFYFPIVTLAVAAVVVTILAFAWDYKRTLYLGVGRKRNALASFAAGGASAIFIALFAALSETINYAILSSNFDFWLSPGFGSEGVISVLFRFLFYAQSIFAIFLLACLNREIWKRNQVVGIVVGMAALTLFVMTALSGIISGKYIELCFSSIYGEFILLAIDVILGGVYFFVMKKGDVKR